MGKPFLGGAFQFGIPLLPEFPDKGFLEEFVSADSFGTSENLRRLANFPTVKVYGSAIADLFQSDRIKMAGGRLQLRQFTLPISFLKGTQTFSPLGIGSEDTIATFHNLGDEITLLIDI